MYTRALSIRLALSDDGQFVYSLLLGRKVVQQLASAHELSDEEATRLLLSKVTS